MPTHLPAPEPRKIIHLDMDCFYAAVEMRERPELAGKPIAVGGGGRRGVVTTCNYEARRYGVRSAMPGFMARELCPHLLFLPIRFDLYRQESQHIRSIMREYTDLLEPLSLDEAYLDVTSSERFAWDIAREIRTRIFATRGLTASAGIAPNKMLAKIASDWRKPNGQFAVLPHQVSSFMTQLPVRKIWGVGPKSAAQFEAEGIHSCGDLQKLTVAELIVRYGRWGEELFRLCRGIDDRDVNASRVRKSYSNERTFSENLTTLEACTSAMSELAEEILLDLPAKAGHLRIRKAFVKVKFSDFSRTTREQMCSSPSVSVFQALLAEAYLRKPLGVRLLGAGVRFAESETDQLDLFEDRPML